MTGLRQDKSGRHKFNYADNLFLLSTHVYGETKMNDVIEKEIVTDPGWLDIRSYCYTVAHLPHLWDFQSRRDSADGGPPSRSFCQVSERQNPFTVVENIVVERYTLYLCRCDWNTLVTPVFLLFYLVRGFWSVRDPYVICHTTKKLTQTSLWRLMKDNLYNSNRCKNTL